MEEVDDFVDEDFGDFDDLPFENNDKVGDSYLGIRFIEF